MYVARARSLHSERASENVLGRDGGVPFSWKENPLEERLAPTETLMLVLLLEEEYYRHGFRYRGFPFS